MQSKSNNFVLTTVQNNNNSSHIFLLKTKLQHSIDDYVEGNNIWEKKKAELINEMALTLEKLHFLGEYDQPLNTISSYIIKRLRERGVSESQAHYVTIVLPSKYKNLDLARDQHQQQQQQQYNNNNGVNFNANDDDQEEHEQQEHQQQSKAVNIYDLKKRLEKLSPTEFQNYMLHKEQRQKHIRDNIKAENEVAEYVAIKNKIPIPRYKKVSAEVPPTHLQHATVLSDRFGLLADEALDLHKYFKDIQKSIIEFPPDEEMAERNAKRVDIFIEGAWKTIKEIFLAPTTDKKWSADWLKWIDIHFTRLEQSKNYAGSKHALETGEFAVKWKDGTQTIFALDRGITREQVGDKEPELFEMCKQMLIGNPMVQALHDWSYNTFIDEEYDADGNPIIK